MALKIKFVRIHFQSGRFKSYLTDVYSGRLNRVYFGSIYTASIVVKRHNFEKGRHKLAKAIVSKNNREISRLQKQNIKLSKIHEPT